MYEMAPNDMCLLIHHNAEGLFMPSTIWRKRQVLILFEFACNCSSGKFDKLFFFFWIFGVRTRINSQRRYETSIQVIAPLLPETSQTLIAADLTPFITCLILVLRDNEGNRRSLVAVVSIVCMATSTYCNLPSTSTVSLNSFFFSCTHETACWTHM